jgi:hypothetical protein
MSQFDIIARQDFSKELLKSKLMTNDMSGSKMASD